VSLSRITAGLAIALAACSSGGSVAQSESFPQEAYAVVASDVGGMTIEARTSPAQPPQAGTCSVELTITEPDGTPAEGITIDAVPWMPAMGHGASVMPTLTPRGGGVYQLDDVDLFMAGRWDLHLTLSGPTSAHATVTFQIE
jgi:YtkA-like